ncbi:MAG: cytochrome c [Burkholderiales bacterium]|nr:cytochrome c [Burkholderiales bacterium]
MTFKTIHLLLAAACAVSATTYAADSAAGKAKAEQICAACHNADGNSTNPQYPILAGQHPDYIKKALRDYKSGARTNAIMAGMAGPLTSADIDNLAEWFSTQKSVLNQAR